MMPEDFIAKIEWEGGVEAAIEYGLEAKDCDHPEVADAWQSVLDNYDDYQGARQRWMGVSAMYGA